MREYPIQQNWNRYPAAQRTLLPNRRYEARRRRFRLRLLLVLVLLVVGGVFSIRFFDFSFISSNPSSDIENPGPVQPAPLPDVEAWVLRSWTAKMDWNRPAYRSFRARHGGSDFFVRTTLSEGLQMFLNQELAQLPDLDRGRPRYAGMVVMEASTGRVLAMGGFDDRDGGNNVCLDIDFPAASLFKIVTASAVLDTGKMSPDTRLAFNGGKYTLYKRQLRDLNNRYTNRISLERAFAESVNPVFGKLGANVLKQSGLETYAARFGFNQMIGAEVPHSASEFTATKDTYHCAELACGFNKDTRISLLHAVVLGAFPLCGGQLPIPCIIDSVKDETGRIRYTHPGNQRKKPAVSPETADDLKRMMTATVRYGTARKSFRKRQPYPLPKGLILGGKTGSIGTRDGDDYRYDWFIGFADSGKDDPAIAVAVLVAHQQYLGIRAADWARRLISRYYES